MEICFKPTWKSFLTFLFSLICWVCAALQRSRLCSLILMTDLYASLFAEQNISMCFWCWLLLQCWCSHSPQSSATGHICLKIENRLQGIVKVCTKITGATLNDFSYLYEATNNPGWSKSPSVQRVPVASIWQEDALTCMNDNDTGLTLLFWKGDWSKSI